MNLQLGIIDFAEAKIFATDIEAMTIAATEAGVDKCSYYREDNLAMVSGGFHTLPNDPGTTQPCISRSGVVVTWDGRLDNRRDLAREFSLPFTSADIEIVAEAYDRLGTDCFAKLLGDWAVVIWTPRKRSVTLAKDFSGIRPLFYSWDEDRLSWSSLLKPLLPGRTLKLSEEYIAGCLSLGPATHLTPYVGVLSVPPSCFVSITSSRRIVNKYWDFNPGRAIRHVRDAEYEAEFRELFTRSVQRRLTSSGPILAELSGGMDSSSIVCVADAVLERGGGETPRLDTVSFYDDDEPNWNERPYFTKVEERRGREGWHIDASRQSYFRFSFLPGELVAAPSGLKVDSRFRAEFNQRLQTGGYRVLLSGVGGDEATGGVPSPFPELEDLVARGRFWKLAERLKIWALDKRKPWFHLFFDTIRAFLPLSVVGMPQHLDPPDWLNRYFVTRNRLVLSGYRSRRRLIGPLPTFEENIATLDILRRQLTCESLPTDPLREIRYPYLDRDFLEFMYAIPREQVVRPGQRRSLMRRALARTVPDEILNRRRKAYVVRSPIAALLNERDAITELCQEMMTENLGIVDQPKLVETMERLWKGSMTPTLSITRVLRIEAWLRRVVAGDREVSSASVLSAQRTTTARLEHLRISEKRAFENMKGLVKVNKRKEVNNDAVSKA